MEQMQMLGIKIVTKVYEDPANMAIASQLEPEMFFNELNIIFTILHKHRARRVVPDEEYMKVFIPRNPKLVLDNVNLINLQSIESEDKVLEYTKLVLSYVNKIHQVVLGGGVQEDIVLLVDKYRQMYKTYKYQHIIDNSQRIVSDGIKLGKTTWMGVDDASKYTRLELAKLEGILDPAKRSAVVEGAEIANREKDDASKPRIVTDFGDLDSLNELYGGGLYTGLFLNVMAPPKSGKSTLCYRLAHTALTKYKVNVAYWALEDREDRAVAKIRAIHFDEYARKNPKLFAGGVPRISPEDIDRGTFSNEDYRALENLSKTDLFESGEYGKLYLMEGGISLDTMIEQMEEAVRDFGVELFVIDYLGYLETGKLAKHEAIGQAYRKLLNFVKARNVALIAPSQFKQEAVKGLAAGGDFDLRVAGGESSEVIRTPDINLALYASQGSIEQQELQVIPLESRVAPSRPGYLVHFNPEISYFSDLKK